MSKPIVMATIPPPPPRNAFSNVAGMLPRGRKVPAVKRCETCGAPGIDKCVRCATVEQHLDGYASTIVGRAKLMHAVHRAEEALGRRAKRTSKAPPAKGPT